MRTFAVKFFHFSGRNLIFLGLFGLLILPGWTVSQEPQIKKNIEVQLPLTVQQAAPDKPASGANTTKVEQQDIILELAADGSGDNARLDKLEKQLEALIKEVRSLRSGQPKQPTRGLEIKLDGQKANMPVIADVILQKDKQGVGELILQKDKPNVILRKDKQEIHSVPLHVNVPVDVVTGHLKTDTATFVVEGDGAITLIRRTYKMPKEKAEALATFLHDQVKGQVLETKVEGDNISITTSAESQRIIGQFIALAQGKTAHENLMFHLQKK
jgi:hypothetical protein